MYERFSMTILPAIVFIGTFLAILALMFGHGLDQM